MIQHPDNKDLQEAKDWAYNLLHNGEKFFILDTETTGLNDAEIVDICVLSQWGQPLLDTLVKPTTPIPSGAIRIHKVTDEMVADAPTFPEIYPKLKQLIEGKKVIIYNEAFDCNIIRYCCKLHNLEPIKFYSECAMLWYAQYYGQWNKYYGNYKWQKLPGGGQHRALSDCRAVHRLLYKMGQFDYDKLRPHTPYQQFPPVQIACKWEKLGQLEFYWKGRRIVNWYFRLPIFYMMTELLNQKVEPIDDDDDIPIPF